MHSCVLYFSVHALLVDSAKNRVHFVSCVYVCACVIGCMCAYQIFMSNVPANDLPIFAPRFSHFPHISVRRVGFAVFQRFFLPLYDSYYASWFDSTGWTHNRQTFRHKIGIYLVCASDRRSDAREGNYFLEYFSTGTGMMAFGGGDVQFQPKGQRQLC